VALLRRRRGADRGAASRYQMREKLIAVGDDSWIEDENGDRAFRVNGKALRIRKTFILEEPGGDEVAKIQERKLSVRDKMEIERGGRSLATVRKRLIGIRDRFTIDVEDGPDMQAKGNFVDHEYEITRDDDPVATISKRWFRVRDTYGVEVGPGEDAALVLAITVCIDAMAHQRD
jgi:uncharacterized protein YxjI